MTGINQDNHSLIGISRLQHRARQLKSSQNLTANQSLNIAAHEQGFSDYQAYLSEIRRQAIQVMLKQSGRPPSRQLSS